jgi:hypothetical protein
MPGRRTEPSIKTRETRREEAGSANRSAIYQGSSRSPAWGSVCIFAQAERLRIARDIVRGRVDRYTLTLRGLSGACRGSPSAEQWGESAAGLINVQVVSQGGGTAAAVGASARVA